MARFLPERGLLIQHIPRCGGTWIEDAIGLTGVDFRRWSEQGEDLLPKKHCMIPHYKRSSMIDVKYVAAFVRHPIAYYESAWKYLCSVGAARRIRMSRHWRWHPFASVSKRMTMDFNGWVEKVLVEHPCWCTRLFELYVGPKGGSFCDFIGRTETLEDDFIQLMKGVGYKTDSWRPILNLMSPKNVAFGHIEWDERLRLEVMRTERPIIDRFYGRGNRRWFGRCFTGPPFQ